MLYAVNNDAGQGASDAVIGLPDSRSAGAVTALFDNGHSLAIADRQTLVLYALDAAARGPRGARVIARHRFDGSVAAMAATALGLLVAVGRGARTELLLVRGESASTIRELEGEAQALAAANGSAFVVSREANRGRATLARIDLRQRRVSAERALPGASLSPTLSASGERLVVADPETRRIVVLGADLEPAISGDEGEGECALPAEDGGVIVSRGGRIEHRSWLQAEAAGASIDLLWPVAVLKRAGRFIVACDATRRHAALLSGDDLSLLTEWQFGREGVTFECQRDSPVMLARHHGQDSWLLIDLARLARSSGHLFDPGAVERVSEKTFIGTPHAALIDGHAPTTGRLDVLVLPVIEGDQVFASANLDGFAAYLQRTAAPLVRDYYAENSFGRLGDIRFSVFGASLGPKGGPLRLPRARLADYHFPPYEPARVELVKNGVTAGTPIVLDGRESLALEANPLEGGPPCGTLNVPFFALGFEQSHDRFPIRVRFLGIEHVHLNVTSPAGVIHALDLAFPARTIEIGAHDMAARLDELAIYLEGVFQSAELSAGVANRIFARPKVQRVPEAGLGFGRLVTTVVSSLANGPKLVINAVTAVGVGSDDALGLGRALPGMIFGGSEAILARYLSLALDLAQEGAGFDHGARVLGPPVVIHEPATSRLTVRLSIADRFGGPGASLKVSASTGLHALFDEGEARPNSATTRDEAQGLRDREALFTDAFSLAVERLRGASMAAEALSAFQVVLVLPVEPAVLGAEDAAAAQAAEAWSVTAPDRPHRLRGGASVMTVVDRADSACQLQAAWALVPFRNNRPDTPRLCRAIGQAIGFRDLDRRIGDRTDFAFLESWALMDRPSGLPHHAGYHKLQAGWIPDARVLTVGPGEPDGDRSVELLLVPVELWREGLADAARAAFGVGDAMPVAQLVRLDRGGDGGAFDLIEARQQGPRYPEAGSAAAANVAVPGIIVTSGLHWSDDARHAVRGLSRRGLHLVNPNAVLREPGERVDLNAPGALALAGATIELTGRQLVDGDAQVFRLKVTRRNPAFADLYFTVAEPAYRNPDLWVDFIGDNGSDRPEDHRVHPPGMPTDQGERIRVHPTRETAHWLVARLRNRGAVPAQSVKLAFKIADPPGGGDRGTNYRAVGSITVPEVRGGDEPITVPVRWSVPGGFPGRGGLLVEIEDYRIAGETGGVPLASAEFARFNMTAEKSVDVIEALHTDSFAPIAFDYAVHNAASVPAFAHVEPEGLGEGLTLTVSPVAQVVPAGQSAIFRCRLELDPAIIGVGARHDRRFRLVTWRREPEAAARWGGVEYIVQPRAESAISLTGYWNHGDQIVLSGQVSPNPGAAIVQLRLDFEGQPTLWATTVLSPAGGFSWTGRPVGPSRQLEAMAWFRGDGVFATARSAALNLRAPGPTLGPSRVG